MFTNTQINNIPLLIVFPEICCFQCNGLLPFEVDTPEPDFPFKADIPEAGFLTGILDGVIGFSTGALLDVPCLLLVCLMHEENAISYRLFVHAIQENINGLGSYHPQLIQTQIINIFCIAWEQTGGNKFITQQT